MIVEKKYDTEKYRYATKWRPLFQTGLVLLREAATMEQIDRAFRMFDCAIGLGESALETNGSGIALHRNIEATSEHTRTGAKFLPLDCVRHVEYERLAIRLACASTDILRIHRLGPAPERNASNFVVQDLLGAANYLAHASPCKDTCNAFASDVLRSLVGDSADCIPPTKQACCETYVAAVRNTDRDRAIALGVYLISPTPPSNRSIAESTSACDTGYRLTYGRLGLRANPKEAVRYYRRALELYPGNATAANNLGMLYCDACHGVEVNTRVALSYMYQAIQNGDKSSAPRNAAIILMEGISGVRKDMTKAVHLLLYQMSYGTERARGKARLTLERGLASISGLLLRPGLRLHARRCVEGKYVPFVEWTCELAVDYQGGLRNRGILAIVGIPSEHTTDPMPSDSSHGRALRGKSWR